MSSSDQNGHLGLAQRESGLIVPVDLADAPDAAAKNPSGPVARDMDGRRRLMFSDEDRRKLNHVLVMLQQHGLGVIVGCLGAGKTHADGRPACGDLLITEGQRTDDPGYGCKCTRIHWVKPTKASQNAFMRSAGGRRRR